MIEPYDCWVSTGRAGGVAPKGFGIQELMPGAPTLMIVPSVIEATRQSPLVVSVDAVSIFRAQIRYEGFTTLSTTPPLTMGMSAVSQYRPPFMGALLTHGRCPLADVDAQFKALLGEIRQGGAQASPPSRARGGAGGGEMRVTLHQRDKISEGTAARGVQLVGTLARLPFYALILLTIGIVASGAQAHTRRVCAPRLASPFADLHGERLARQI